METKIKEQSDRIVCTIIVNGGVHDNGVTYYFEEGDEDSLDAARSEAVAWATGVRNAFDAISAFTMLQASQASGPQHETYMKQRRGK